MSFRRNRNNNEDENRDQEESTSRPSVPVPSAFSRQRKEALAVMIGNFLQTKKNSSSSALVVDTTMDTKIKIEKESPTGSAADATATTVSISTIESEQRLAMSGMRRSPQFANALLSPSFQLPSPTEEGLEESNVEVTFAKKFSHMFESKDEDEADVGVLTAIDEEENDDGEQLSNQVEQPSVENAKEDLVGVGTMDQSVSKSRLAILEEFEKVSKGVETLKDTIESQSDPFLAIRQGEVRIPDRKGRPPPSPRSLNSEPQEDNHENNDEDSVVDDHSVQSQATERTSESKISRFSLTQELLNSPAVSTIAVNNDKYNSEDITPSSVVLQGEWHFELPEDDKSVHSEITEKTYESKISRFSITQEVLNSPAISTIEDESKAKTPKPLPRYPKSIADSPASKVSYLSISEMDSPQKKQNNMLPPSDMFTGSRLSMTGEIEVLGASKTNHASTSESRSQESSVLPTPKVPEISSSDWDEQLDPVDFIRYANSTAQGRPPRFPNPKKDCGRYKTWQVVHQRLKESCPDTADWGDLDPVLLDRCHDSQEVDKIHSKDEHSSPIPSPRVSSTRHETLQMVRLRLQQSSPSESDWDEKERDALDATSDQYEYEETTFQQDSSNQYEDFQQDPTSSMIRQAQDTCFDIESFRDGYSDKVDRHLAISRLDGPSELASRSRWNRKTSTNSHLYRRSGPVDFDKVYENTYGKTQTAPVDNVYLLRKQRGQSIGVNFRKFKRRSGIYVESLDPNGLASRAAARNIAVSEVETSQRSFLSVFKRGKGLPSRNSTHSLQFRRSLLEAKSKCVGRLKPGMKIEMINGQPCPSDLQVCVDMVAQTSGWLTLHLS